MNLTLKHIEMLDAIIRHCSFHKAAVELHLSQPALSRSIAILEEQVGEKLYERTTKSVTPTRCCEYLVKNGLVLVKEMRVLQRDIRLMQALEAGEIQIGAGPVVAQTFLGAAIGHLSRDYPRISMTINVDRPPNLITRLRNRELDLCIADITGLSDQSEFDVVALPSSKGYFCCRVHHPLADRANLSIEDIRKFPLAIPWMPSNMTARLGQLLGTTHEDLSDYPCGVIHSDNFQIVHDIIASSDAVGVTTKEILASRPQQDVRILQEPELGLATNFGIICKKSHSVSPVVKVIKQYIIENIRMG